MRREARHFGAASGVPFLDGVDILPLSAWHILSQCDPQSDCWSLSRRSVQPQSFEPKRAQVQEWPRFHAGVAVGTIQAGPDFRSIGVPEAWPTKSVELSTGQKVVAGFRPARVGRSGIPIYRLRRGRTSKLMCPEDFDTVSASDVLEQGNDSSPMRLVLSARSLHPRAIAVIRRLWKGRRSSSSTNRFCARRGYRIARAGRP